MMVEPFFPRSEEDAKNINSTANDIFQSFDGMLMDDIFAIGSPSDSTSVHPDEAPLSPPVMEAAAAFTLDDWRLQNPSNPVHMHIQENAKIPFINYAVNRKHHTSSPPLAPEKASKMAESFLSNRQSFHASYQQAGALAAHAGAPVAESRERRDSLDADVLEAFLADIDPTPLSEIKERHAAHQQRQTAPLPSARSGTYSRKAPLPIPTKRISPPVSPESQKRRAAGDAKPVPSMQRALATAAALAASRPKGMTSHTPVGIHRASGQKARYGFGSNHVVPAVPAPPQKHRATTAAAVAVAVRKPPVAPPPPPPVSHVAKDVGMVRSYSHEDPSGGEAANQGDAYERKKQRAKHARVKLNESIERLSVAMALAGTQSRERRQQWQELAGSPEQEAAMQITADCVDTADSAKKWDRPSFVGSAASLIQGLNAQCEAMMREIHRLREGEQAPIDVPVPVVPSVPIAPSPPPVAPVLETDGPSVAAPANPVEKKHAAQEVPNGESPCKRVKTDSAASPARANGNHLSTLGGETQWENLDMGGVVFGQPKLLVRIVNYLDPLSLLRCQRINKAFKVSASQEDLWVSRCTSRFGYFNVRQWRAKLDDEDEGITAQSTVLYRSMDRANVMPEFHHEGLFLLGESRLPNKVSAWVFLVERSNGETMRSVRRRPDMTGSGVYTTLPIIELRTVIQNTGVISEAIKIREQTQTVDASTRRRGEDFKSVDWDDRFGMRVFHLDGSRYNPPEQQTSLGSTRPAEICRLKLFESVVLTSYIYARGCSTNSKFVQRANFTKVLVALDSGITVPLVIPFPRDASHLQH
jgi:hypothetical protein